MNQYRSPGTAKLQRYENQMMLRNHQIMVTIVPIDSIIPSDSFDFIKIDVEGYDFEALSGMKNLLKRSNAVLAISVYHRAFDIINLPLFVMELLMSSVQILFAPAYEQFF